MNSIKTIKYKYFVSWYSKDGFDKTILALNERIIDITQIKNLERQIETDRDVKEVCIISFVFLDVIDGEIEGGRINENDKS